MELFDKLYDEFENAKVRFIGFTTNSTRYDFGIIYTNMLIPVCHVPVNNSVKKTLPTIT